MIKVEKGKSTVSKFGNESLFISFPYNNEIVQKVKSLPNRKYHNSTKCWEAPLEEIGNILKLFNSNSLDIGEDVDINYIPKNEFDIHFFDSTLNNIESESIRDFTSTILQQLPEYFWTISASSTGKYHPRYALGTGGLVRHTKAALLIAEELFNNTLLYEFTSIEKDIIRSALHLHDGIKHGVDGGSYTVSTHPLDVANFIRNSGSRILLNTVTLNAICECIESHMGQWNTDYKTKEEILPLPITEIQKFTHLCDYLASRKLLEVVFND